MLYNLRCCSRCFLCTQLCNLGVENLSTPSYGAQGAGGREFDVVDTGVGHAQVDDTGRVDESLLDSLEHDLREPRRRRTRRRIQCDSDSDGDRFPAVPRSSARLVWTSHNIPVTQMATEVESDSHEERVARVRQLVRRPIHQRELPGMREVRAPRNFR